MAIPVLTILSLFCSYLFSHLYTKNKKWGCWGFILYIGAIILYTYLLSKNWGLVFWSSNLRSLALGVLNMMCPTIWGLLDPQCGT